MFGLSVTAITQSRIWQPLPTAPYFAAACEGAVAATSPDPWQRGGNDDKPDQHFEGVQGGLLDGRVALARPEQLPLGLPGERPRSFGAAAGVLRTGSSVTKPRKTPVGVSFSIGSGLSNGSRRSATMPRARHSWCMLLESTMSIYPPVPDTLREAWRLCPASTASSCRWAMD